MITIGIATRMLRVGGTERVIARLSCIWQEGGYRIVLLTAMQPEPEEYPHACEVRQQFDFETATCEEVEDLIKRHRIDLMIFNGGWNNRNFGLQVSFLHALGTRTICINHHAFSNWAFFLNNADDFYKDEVKGCIDALVCVNPIQALWWRCRGFKAVYIPNPVAILLPVSNSYKHGKNLVWIGRPLDIGKRLPLMLMLLGEILKKEPETHLIIAGEITEKRQKELLESVGLGDRNNISFAGYVSNTLDIMSKASVHVLTSVLEVTAPQVLLESAVLGIPTVMFELPVCFDAIREHGAIQIHEGENHKFVNAVIEIMRNPGLAQELSDKAYRWGQLLGQRDLQSSWKSLFEAVLTRDDGFFERSMRDVENIENYERALKEVCRSEKYFVAHYFHILKAYTRFQLWKNILANKLRFR